MPEQTTSAKVRFSAVANIGLLLGGYGCGQGAVFAAQSWLMAIGEYQLLAAFGTHFLFAIFGNLLVDAGSLTTLARHAAASPRETAARSQLWQAFWDRSVFRMVLAMALVAAAIIYALSPVADGFSRNYTLLAAPAFLFFAGNAAGLLDGFKFSGVSGLSGAVPYATSALVLVLARHASPEVAGAALGAAFSGGCLLMVAAQWIALARFGWRPRLQTTTARGFRAAAWEAGAMLGVLMPGQVYGRAQLVLSSTYLGAETTAFLIYAKQVITGVAQIMGFIQRVEFPVLVARLSVPDENLFRTIFNAQKLVATVGIIAAVAVFAAGFAVAHWPESRFGAVAPLLSAFSPTILTMSALIMLAQALAATGNYEGLALDNIIFNLIGGAASYLFLKKMGVYAFAAGDVLSTGCGVLLLLSRLSRSKQNVAAAVEQLP